MQRQGLMSLAKLAEISHPKRKFEEIALLFRGKKLSLLEFEDMNVYTKIWVKRRLASDPADFMISEKGKTHDL